MSQFRLSITETQMLICPECGSAEFEEAPDGFYEEPLWICSKCKKGFYADDLHEGRIESSQLVVKEILGVA